MRSSLKQLWILTQQATNFPNLQKRKKIRKVNRTRMILRQITVLRKKKVKTNLIVNMHLKRNYVRRKVFSIKKTMTVKLKSICKG